MAATFCVGRPSFSRAYRDWARNHRRPRNQSAAPHRPTAGSDRRGLISSYNPREAISAEPQKSQANSRGLQAVILVKELNRMSNEQLLDLRLRDLPLKISGTPLEGVVTRLYEELDARGLRFKPHVWLSEDWFTPDKVSGFAIPFYLAHPRLIKLERRQMLQVEGGSENECLRIMRHEVGHALDNAFDLHRRRRYRETFGPFSRPYPDWYKPEPNSRDYVVHLPGWYAQAHPAEDFAETFAVWMAPGSRWRRRYEGWRAMRKLEYVAEVMREISGKVA